MKEICRIKKYLTIIIFILLVFFGACVKDEIIPIPKVSAGPDLELQAPLSLIELDASETFKKNPDGNGLNVSWKVISQPSRSQVVKIDPPANITSASSKTSVSRLTEGVYQFQLSANFDQGPMAYDTLELRIRPNPGSSNYLSFSNLIWDGYADPLFGEYASLVHITDSVSLINNLNNSNSEILVWDYEKKDWLNSIDYKVEKFDWGISISTFTYEYRYLIRKKSWVLIKIL